MRQRPTVTPGQLSDLVRVRIAERRGRLFSSSRTNFGEVAFYVRLAHARKSMTGFPRHNVEAAT